MRKVIFFIFIFYILTLIQTSFLVHFRLFDPYLNIVLISVIIFNIFSSSCQEKIISAVIGGFFLDIFSLDNIFGFFGFYTLILFLFSVFLAIIPGKYFRAINFYV